MAIVGNTVSEIGDVILEFVTHNELMQFFKPNDTNMHVTFADLVSSVTGKTIRPLSIKVDVNSVFVGAAILRLKWEDVSTTLTIKTSLASTSLFQYTEGAAISQTNINLDGRGVQVQTSIAVTGGSTVRVRIAYVEI